MPGWTAKTESIQPIMDQSVNVLLIYDCKGRSGWPKERLTLFTANGSGNQALMSATVLLA